MTGRVAVCKVIDRRTGWKVYITDARRRELAADGFPSHGWRLLGALLGVAIQMSGYGSINQAIAVNIIKRIATD
jgi:hypothetical protein